MANYSKLAPIVAGQPKSGDGSVFIGRVVAMLIDLWLAEYRARGASNDIVETSADGFSYLFDVGRERLIAAWGVSGGKHTGARPASRMAGHPLSAGSNYHRGHAIAHTLGGGTDINLVPQLGQINVGPFRKLEKEAVATPGALYFTYWLYGAGNSQTPTGVEQGLLVRGSQPQITRHGN